LFAAFASAGFADPGIVGGEFVAPDDPIAASTAALMWDDLLVCSAAVLDVDILVTAAHCLGLPREAVFGNDAGRADAPRRKIVGVREAPGWDLSRYDQDPVPRGLYDIAV